MGKKWVKNEITGVQKTALMHASAGLAPPTATSCAANQNGKKAASHRQETVAELSGEGPPASWSWPTTLKPSSAMLLAA